nr:hypothetical protein [uncultured Ottowia sp.]
MDDFLETVFKPGSKPGKSVFSPACGRAAHKQSSPRGLPAAIQCSSQPRRPHETKGIETVQAYANVAWSATIVSISYTHST